MAELLIPISVEAIMANKYNPDEKKIGQVTPEYDRLSSTILGDNIESKPFTRAQPLQKGVHLHFILPDALTHGEETQHGFSYPCIPNRWLVTRIMPRQTDDEPLFRHKSWIVESDYVGLDNTDSVPIATLDDKENRFKFLGRSYPLEQRPGSGSSLSELTVFGTGDPAFAAYYPSCKSALGFHDPLDDVNNAMLGYMVSGWYSEPKKDPLHGATKANWQQLMDKYSWSAQLPSPMQADQYPTRSLYHGAVFFLDWRGDAYPYPSGQPEGIVEVSAGNTSVEALSALIARKMRKNSAVTEEMERFLNAMQYDILDEFNELDGISKVENSIHRNEFSFEESGKLWTLKADDSVRRRDKTPLPDSADLLLQELNLAQEDQNRAEREFDSLKARLYNTWHTYMLKYEIQPPPQRDKKPFKKDIYSEFNKVYGEIETLSTRIAALVGKVEEKKTQLLDSIIHDAIPYVLEQIPGARYCKPNPPVLLFSGDGLARSYIYGEDGRFSKDGTLLCRFSGQEVCQLDLTVRSSSISIKESDILANSGGWSAGDVPFDLKRLFCESVLLDRTHAQSLAVIAYDILKVSPSKKDLEELAAQIEKILMTPWNGMLYSGFSVQQIADTVGLHGIIPSKVGVNFWTPTWNTLFLEWRVGYYPTKTVNKPDNSLNAWQWGGIDYSYTKQMPSLQEIPFFTGRTVVTPHSQRILKNAIDKQIERYSGDPEISAALKKVTAVVKDLSLLSQSLGGFTEMLVSLRNTLQFPFMITSGDLEDDGWAIEMTAKLNGCLNGCEVFPPDNTTFFFPIRSGFLKVNKIQLFSSFGQIQILATGLDDVIVSETMLPPEQIKKAICLPPRVSQYARLLYSWERDRAASPSPVCGFIVPNRLNNGIMVYDSAGTMLGTVQLVYRSGGTKAAVWISAPLLQLENFDDVEFASVHLREFVRSIRCPAQKERTALEELMEYLDTRQSQTLIEDDSHAQDYALLCGRPVVLARASVELELKGNPAYLQDIPRLGEYETNGFDALRFPVMIGDALRRNDGLAGYYPGGDPERIYSKLHAAFDSDPDSTQKYIVYGQTVDLNFNADNIARMTVLMEPAGELTIRTGILPAQTLRLPEHYYADALQNMYMGFEINPVISPPDEVSLPFSEERGSLWSWAYRLPEGGYVENKGITTKTDVFSKRQFIMDGYLIKRGEQE